MNNIENKQRMHSAQRAHTAQRTRPAQRPHPTQKRRRKYKISAISRCIIVILTVVNIILSCLILSLAINDKKEVAEGEPSVHKQTIIRTIETKQEPVEAFPLTSEQRTLIEQVVSAESRGEPYDGQVAVAQCILNACLKDGITPEQAIEKYKYTSARVEPTDSVKEAVAAVFDRGEGVTEEPILYFYAPARVSSDWHNSQILVIEIANHRFFKEA